MTLGVSKYNCPLPCLYWMTGTKLISNEILQRKILFLYHVATLPWGALARDFHDVQREHDLGLVAEVQPVLQEWNLNNIECYSKAQFKKILKNLIYEKNRKEILDWMRGYKKISLDKCKNKPHKMQDYFKKLNVQESRMKFRIDCFLVPTIRLNFKSNKKYKAEKWLCPDCTPECVTKSSGPPGDLSSPSLNLYADSQEHAYVCLGNSDLRQGRDLDDTRDLVTFFSELVDRRKLRGKE